MIIDALLNMFADLGRVLGLILPSVETLPLGIDEALSTAIGWIRSLIEVAWPVEVILEVVLWYITFRIALTLIKLFLGHRAPAHH